MGRLLLSHLTRDMAYTFKFTCACLQLAKHVQLASSAGGAPPTMSRLALRKQWCTGSQIWARKTCSCLCWKSFRLDHSCRLLGYGNLPTYRITHLYTISCKRQAHCHYCNRTWQCRQSTRWCPKAKDHVTLSRGLEMILSSIAVAIGDSSIIQIRGQLADRLIIK